MATPVTLPLQPFVGYSALVTLDYGHLGQKPEHSLIVIPNSWSDLRALLTFPFEYLLKAKVSYTIAKELRQYLWDPYGPLTIILDPLTNPSRANADALRHLAIAFDLRAATEVEFVGKSATLHGLIDNPSKTSQSAWRTALMTIFNGSCPGFFMIEYALYTRVMIVRYIPPSTYKSVYDDAITPVTISDFSDYDHKGQRPGFMHFDLKKLDSNTKLPVAYTHQNVASLKADFVVDYITNHVQLLNTLCDSSKITFVQGSAARDFTYCDVNYFKSNGDLAEQVPQKASAIPSLVNTSKLNLVQAKGNTDPRVVMESVDPWADGRVWNDKPKMGRFAPVPTTPNGDIPHPCILIYVIINGQGMWVIDPDSATAKNYVAPYMPSTGKGSGVGTKITKGAQKNTGGKGRAKKA